MMILVSYRQIVIKLQDNPVVIGVVSRSDNPNGPSDPRSPGLKSRGPVDSSFLPEFPVCRLGLYFQPSFLVQIDAEPVKQRIGFFPSHLPASKSKRCSRLFRESSGQAPASLICWGSGSLSLYPWYRGFAVAQGKTEVELSRLSTP